MADQSLIWLAIGQNQSENGQWPAVILYSVTTSRLLLLHIYYFLQVVLQVEQLVSNYSGSSL